MGAPENQVWRAPALALCVALAGCEDAGNPTPGATGDGEGCPDTGTPCLRAEVVDVTDGDTIDARVRGSVESIRYIGIDAPEVHHPDLGREPYGPEATRANGDLVGGRVVWLSLGRERRDDYDRLLAYVYRADGTFVNAELVRGGWAEAFEVPPNTRHADLFRRLERRARRAGRGQWETE